eukprot:COSAG04_NODE_413_length_14740_cov_85.508572_4_plen_62_part_00
MFWDLGFWAESSAMLETGDDAVGHAALSRVELRAIGDQVRLKILTQDEPKYRAFLRIWGQC